MFDRIRIRYYIMRRDRWLKRLARDDVDGNELFDHPKVKHWQQKILDIMMTTDASRRNS